ncbi:MAG: hypothetical protein Q7S42_06595, partial [Candidatus Omnitrophota bacterium]|nr:hypothetical protein [Candidatus Omnitrophota bacterium]
MQVFLRSALLFFSLLVSVPLAYCTEPVGCANIEESKTKYLAANQYNEFIESLDNPKEKDLVDQLCLNYYKAQVRYLQLKYLEEKQSWDEYFNKGNNYREEITSGLEEVIKSTAEKDPLQLYAKLLLWQFHQDQQDVFAEESLASLMAAAKVYVEGSIDVAPIRDVADK